MQTVQLSDGELSRLVSGKNVTKGGWTFVSHPDDGGLVSFMWEELRDGEIDKLSWDDYGVSAIQESDDDSERAEVAAHLFSAFLNTNGEARDSIQKALHKLDYHIEREYKLVDTEEDQ